MTPRQAAHARLSEMAGLSPDGAILPPTETAIDREPVSWWGSRVPIVAFAGLRVYPNAVWDDQA